MADLLLKNNEGKLWQNTNGKMLKARNFSEDVLQDGLEFWGRADRSYLTFVDGLVSEASDIRGTGSKMVQNTAVNRPVYQNGALRFETVSNSESGWTYLTKTGVNVKSMFIVAKSVTLTIYIHGLGFSVSYGLIGETVGFTGTTNKAGYAANTSTFYDSVVNGQILDNTYLQIPVGDLAAIHSLTDVNRSNSTIYLAAGRYHSSVCISEVLEWGWYDRLLTQIEVIYNINALNKRYNIF